MGKLTDRLNKQLNTEHKQEAEDCIKIYDYLKDQDKDGCVWSSKWNSLTDVTFKGFPSDDRWYKPNNIGYLVLKAIDKDTPTVKYQCGSDCGDGCNYPDSGCGFKKH
jgi:hypothetical protein